MNHKVTFSKENNPPVRDWLKKVDAVYNQMKW